LRTLLRTSAQIGQETTLRLSGDDAFGELDPDLVATLPIDQAPPGIAEGAVLRLWTGQKVR
jgi:FKBP-type peptidyl-prolyl cis-trans isomerase 2